MEFVDNTRLRRCSNKFLWQTDQSSISENSLIISFVQRARGDRLQVVDAGESFLERSAKNGTENRLAHTSIRTINLQHSQLRPQDRSNLSHLAIITTTSPISKPKSRK